MGTEQAVREELGELLVPSPHPDHLRVHDISLLAFDRAGDPDWYPELGEPFQPSKMYYSGWSRARTLAVHEERGLGLAGQDPLIAGDVVAVEPSLWDNRIGALMIEELVLVTDSGPELLTQFTHDLHMLGG